MQRAFRSALALIAAAMLLLASHVAAQAMRVEATATDLVWSSSSFHHFFAGHATDGSTDIVVGRTLLAGDMDTMFGGDGLVHIGAQPGVTSVRVVSLYVDYYGNVVVASRQDGNYVFNVLQADGSTASFPPVTTDAGAGLTVNAVYMDGSYQLYAIGSYNGPETNGIATAAIARYFFGTRDLNWGSVNGIRLYNLPNASMGSGFGLFTPTHSSSLMVSGVVLDGTRSDAIVVGLRNYSLDIDTGFNGGTPLRYFLGASSTVTAIALGNYSGTVDLGITSSAQAFVSQITSWGYQYGTGSVGPFFGPDGDSTTFTANAVLEDLYGSGPFAAGTAIDSVTGRAYFAFMPTTCCQGPVVSPITADADDFMTGAYPSQTGQFVAFGTRESTAGESALRVRYFEDGTYDTDFSLGPDNTVPNPFAFPADGTPYGPGATAISRAIRVSGVTAASTTISVTGGQYWLGTDPYSCANPSSAPATVTNGQWVCVSAITASTPDTPVNVVLDVGGEQAQYTATTGTTASTTIYSKPSSPSPSSVSFAYTSNYQTSPTTFECQLDGAAFSACPLAGISYSGLAGGLHTFSVRAVNPWGAEPSPPSYTWTVAAPPTTSITSSPAALTNQTSATFGFVSNDPAATFECKLDNGAFSACPNPVTYTGLATAAHAFSVRARNTAGTDPSPPSYNWTIDTTRPVTTISSAPASTTSFDMATFTFASSKAGSTFQCALDGVGPVGCASPAAYSGLSNGSHTFRVFATDALGNADLNGVGWTWTVNATPPHTTITIEPTNPTQFTNAGFYFSSTKADATFQCSLDGAPYVTCVSPQYYSNLAEGTHVFRVLATDSAGHADLAPPAYTWTVDTTPPMLTITSGPNPVGTATSATFTFTSSEPGTLSCSLDLGTSHACSSPVSYSGLSEGWHIFTLSGSDAAGNGAVVQASWAVSIVPPTTTLSTGTPALTNSTSSSFSFSATSPIQLPGGLTSECSLDGAAYATCSSPVTLSNLGDGSHVFTVRTTDAAGVQEINPPAFSWTVDTTAPHTTITSGPTPDTNANIAAFTFTSSEPNATFVCLSSVPGDNPQFHPCTSPVTYAGLADGTYVFYVRAIDQVGNEDPSWNGYQWTVDTSAPDTSITSGPQPLTHLTNATFTFAVGDTNNFSLTSQCQLDGGGFSACTSPVTYSSIVQGSHTFMVRGIDGAGNVDPTPASLAWTVDTTAPSTTITSGPSAPVSSVSATFAYASSEQGSTFSCKLDGAAYGPCPDASISYSGLAQGSHTFSVYSTDPAGNDGAPTSRSWIVDTIAPATTITGGPTGTVTATSATLTYSASESNVIFHCQLDGAAYVTCPGAGSSYSGLAQGSHTFTVYATDPAGNAGAGVSRSWTVDTIPDTTITAFPPALANSTSASFSFTATETATYQCKLDSGSFVSCTSPKAYTGLGQGSHTFQAKATDSTGHVDPSPASYTWTVDTTAPDTTITGGPSGNNNPSTATFTFTSTESGSTFQCKLDSGAFVTCTSPAAYSGLARGSHTFQVRSTDAAGNTDATPATRSWSVK